MKPRTPNKKPEQDRSKNKEISELKRENHTLKRQLSRLQKQVTKLLDVRGEPDYDEPTNEPANFAGSSIFVPVCEACGSQQLARIDLPIGALVICKDCKHRKKA